MLVPAAAVYACTLHAAVGGIRNHSCETNADIHLYTLLHSMSVMVSHDIFNVFDVLQVSVDTS